MTATNASTSEKDGLRERLGTLIGRMWAPVIAAGARLREARFFHPDGHIFAGTSEPVTDPGGHADEALSAIGTALDGRVLARFSGALRRGEAEHFDVLGLALRFRSGLGDLDERPRPGDTDLLTATIRSPLTMLASPLFTDASDFAGNKYWAVSPFEVPGARVELRLIPEHASPRDGTRLERLRTAVAAGRAVWSLEARRTLHLRWQRIARIEIDRELELDQAKLRFDPFRGILRPVGLVQSIRRFAYPASQDARPGHQTTASAPVEAPAASSIRSRARTPA